MSDSISQMWREIDQEQRNTRGDDMRAPDVPGPYVTGGLPALEDGAWTDAGEQTGAKARRGAILLEAHRVINGERQQQYGSPEDSHAVIASMWNGYLEARGDAGCGKGLSSSDVAHMMVLFKLARQINGAGKRDNYVDAAGYLGIASDIQDSRTQGDAHA